MYFRIFNVTWLPSKGPDLKVNSNTITGELVSQSPIKGLFFKLCWTFNKIVLTPDCASSSPEHLKIAAQAQMLIPNYKVENSY